MKKLNRNLANIPYCLTNLSHPTHNWGSVELVSCKPKIWKRIYQFQGKYCAYCETQIAKGNQHIEHFKDKSTHPLETFSWTNLFGCCESRDHCGHYKDAPTKGGIKRSPDHTKLLKPDLDDPEQFLQFVNTGGIKEKKGLNDDDFAKAQETIKALNLNHPSLNSSRHGQIQRFEQQLKVLGQFQDSPIFEAEYKKIHCSVEYESHRTAIKQVLFP